MDVERLGIVRLPHAEGVCREVGAETVAEADGAAGALGIAAGWVAGRVTRREASRAASDSRGETVRGDRWMVVTVELPPELVGKSRFAASLLKLLAPRGAAFSTGLAAGEARF